MLYDFVANAVKNQCKPGKIFNDDVSIFNRKGRRKGDTNKGGRPKDKIKRHNYANGMPPEFFYQIEGN